MKILAADTALGACSAAVLDDANVLAHRFVPMDRGHAEAVAPMVKDAMREAKLGFAALDRLAVTVGPGTFTGQRVGLAFMRGLRVALHRPLIGITTLEAMAHQAMGETGLTHAAALHDAKRGEVYFAVYDSRSEIIPPRVAPLETAIQTILGLQIHTPLALAGTAAEAAVGKLHARMSSVRWPDALQVAKLGRLKPEPSSIPKPLYLRPSDARLPEGAP